MYSFTIESVCNNKLENFVKVTYDETRFDLRIVPSADVIKTMAPMDGMLRSPCDGDCDGADWGSRDYSFG